MSLKDIGKFHKDVSLINSISDGLDFSDNNKYNKAFNSVRDSLEGLNVDDAAKKLRSLKINPDLAVDLLNAAKNADLLIGSTDEIADGIKKVSASSKNVSGLKDAFHGLFNVVKANPFKTAALAATAVGVGVYTYYKKQKEELIKNAHEVTSAWKESTDNLDSQMTQYKSLKEKLDSGTLSSSEEISVKQQILDIQNQIVSKYGEQASGINLVNGELGTQLALMQQISSENAKTTLNKSRKEYADAKNEMTKTRRYNLGNFNERDLTKSTYNSIKSLAKEFEKYGVYLGETGGSVYLSFEGDATQASEVVDNFMKRLSTIQSELDSGSSDYNIVDKILNDSSTSLSKNQKVLDNYQESYKTFLQMDMMSQGTGEGSIGKVFNDYTKSVEKYNNALSSGDTTKIKEARREFSSMSQTVQDALAMDGNKNFKLLFDDVEEQLNKSAAKAEDFKQILSGDSSKSNQFKDIAKDATTASEEIKKLKLDSADIKNALMTNGIQDGESSILKLSTAWGITADSSEEEIQSFIDVLVNAGIVSDGVAQGISQNSELISESFSQFKTSAIDAINSVDALNAALANSVSGKGLSVGIDESGNLTGDLADVISMYGDLEGYDPSIVFERTANGIHLNREALRQLQAQQEALQKQDFINQQTELQKRLNEAIAEQQKYQKGTEEYDSAGAVVSDLQNQLQTVQLLASAYDGATSAYQKWLNAQSNGEEGDMYRNVSKTMKERGDELYKEGRYNTEEFRAIADFYSNEDLTNASMEKVVQAYEAAAQARERYFTGDKQGIDNFMYDLQNNAELVSQGVVKTLEDGTIEFSANSDKILAEQFNLSEEAIQSILRAAEEYNDKIKLGDLDSGNLNEKLAEATAKAEEAKEKLKELKEAGSESLNIDFNFDSTDINDLNNQINSAKENLNQFKNSDGVVDLSIDGADEAVNKKGRMAFADGTAHATLNAYSGGSWVFGDTGNGNLGGTNYSPAPRKSSSKSSSKSTSTSNAEKAAKDALDAISGYFDWVKVRFDRLARETELAENAIENAVGLFEKQSATSKTIEKVQAEINAAKVGADRYLSHANWYAGKSGLSADIQNQVKSGTIDISKYDEDTQKKISEYQSWYENYLDALDKVIDLQKKENELAQQRLENIEDFYELVNNVHSSLTDAIDASLELEEMKGFSGVSDSVKQAIQKQIQAAEEVYNQTAKQLADYQAEFNDLVSKGYIKEGSDAWYEGQAKLNEFNKALSEAEMSIIEFDDKLREIEYTKIQNIIDGFDRAVSKLDKKIELMEARDEKIPESLYQEQINTNDSQIIANKQLRDKKLAEQSKYDVNSKRYQELAEEINKLDEETLQLMTDNEKLKDSIFELRFDPLNEGIKKSKELRDELNSFYDLLNEDAFFDKNGGGTAELAAGLAIIAQGMNAAKQEIKDYQTGLEKLEESFKNGVISEKELEEASAEYTQQIQDTVKDVEKYKDTIIELYKTQMKKEAEVTTELIEKYDDARHAKERYYEYDKKLKNQTKNVNLLKAQIAALESVNIICRMCFNCWKPVKLYKLQRRNEICSSVNV